MNRVAEVNRELKRRGIPEKLRKGKGYYYFTGPNADYWFDRSVGTFRADGLSVERWLKEYDNLNNDFRNHRELGK